MLRRQIKGRMDGIGSRRRPRASDAKGEPLADRAYPIEAIADIPAAMATAGAWLRNEMGISSMAAGHRVVHGGPHLMVPTDHRRHALYRWWVSAGFAPLQRNIWAGISPLFLSRSRSSMITPESEAGPADGGKWDSPMKPAAKSQICVANRHCRPPEDQRSARQ